MGPIEWAAAKHGGRGKRGWKKLHLAVDHAGVIVAQALTKSTTDDPTTGVHFVKTVPGDIATVRPMRRKTLSPSTTPPVNEKLGSSCRRGEQRRFLAAAPARRLATGRSAG